jgi:hypothetical protein
MSELRVVETFRTDLLAATPRRRLRPRWLLGGIGLVVLVGGAATAATGSFPIGTPLHEEGPSEFGRPVPHTAKLQLVRAADPDGGPEWGLRVFKTKGSHGPPERLPVPGKPAPPRLTNGVCEQIGRIVDGKLGVIATDGRFHALPVGPTNACMFGGGGPHPAPFTTSQPGYVGGGSYEATSSGAPVKGYRNVPCDCAGQRRVVLWGAVTKNTVAMDLGGRRYPIVGLRFLIVLKTRPHARLKYVLRDGRVVSTPPLRR